MVNGKKQAHWSWLIAVFVFFVLVIISFPPQNDAAEEKLVNVKPSKTQSNKQGDFYGMVLLGTFEEAKRGGFTDCKADYYHFECVKSKKESILDVEPTVIRVYLDGKNNLADDYYLSSHDGDVRSLSPEKLTYRNIYIDMPDDEYNEKCVSQKTNNDILAKPPIDCIKKKGIDYFAHMLEKNEWVKSGISYYHYGIPVQIETERMSGYTIVKLYPESLENVNNVIQDVKHEAQLNNNAKNVIEHMKS